KNTPNAAKKPSQSKKKKPAKPTGFKEFEALAKEIVEANDGSYYEWLHKQHQEIILNFNVHNRKQITEVAKQSQRRLHEGEGVENLCKMQFKQSQILPMGLNQLHQF